MVRGTHLMARTWTNWTHASHSHLPSCCQDPTCCHALAQRATQVGLVLQMRILPKWINPYKGQNQVSMIKTATANQILKLKRIWSKIPCYSKTKPKSYNSGRNQTLNSKAKVSTTSPVFLSSTAGLTFCTRLRTACQPSRPRRPGLKIRVSNWTIQLCSTKNLTRVAAWAAC